MSISIVLTLVALAVYGALVGLVCSRVLDRGRDGLAWLVFIVMIAAGVIGAAYVIGAY